LVFFFPSFSLSLSLREEEYLFLVGVGCIITCNTKNAFDEETTLKRFLSFFFFDVWCGGRVFFFCATKVVCWRLLDDDDDDDDDDDKNDDEFGVMMILCD